MLNKRLTMWWLGVAALALAGTAWAQDTIKFGVVTSLSGPFVPWGIPARDGMKMAVDELNAKGGVLGRKLELIERDDKSNPSEGVTALRYMIEREGVVAAGGVISSDVGLAVSREAESLRTPFFLAMSGAGSILHKSSRFTFRTCLAPAPEDVEAIANLIKDRNYTRVGAIVADYAWGYSVLDAINALIKPLPGLKLQTEMAPVREQDFTPYLRKLQSLDPQVLITLSHPPGTPIITRQAIELGMKALIIGSGGFPPKLMMQRVGESMFNQYVDFSCADYDSPAYKALAAKFNKTYKHVLDSSSFSGYVMIKMVANAIEKTKSTDPKAIAEAIRTGTFDQPGYGWPLSYTEWGEMKGAKPILFTYEKGDPGEINAGANWLLKVVFRSPPVHPYVPKD